MVNNFNPFNNNLYMLLNLIYDIQNKNKIGCNQIT